MIARVAVLAALAVLIAGCDSDDDSTGSAGDVPITAPGLAYVAADHVGRPDVAGVDELDWFDAFADDAVAVDLRYHPTKNYPGDSVTVTLGTLRVPDLLDCDATVGMYTQGCAETPDGTLRWNLDDPEEDPGGVFVLVPKSDGQTVLVTFNGPRIHRDPRKVDLPVSVDTVFEIANDPRLDVTTSEHVENNGIELPYQAAG
ncbi:hypothetical protein GCM10009795_022350 [Nocardioides hankookensis]|uniref:Lipoprotein n=1 Tax=Nocardioides hankookensis TaxID=443157 RepID=A0ABW1LGF6_9ACTN